MFKITSGATAAVAAARHEHAAQAHGTYTTGDRQSARGCAGDGSESCEERRGCGEAEKQRLAHHEVHLFDQHNASEKGFAIKTGTQQADETPIARLVSSSRPTHRSPAKRGSRRTLHLTLAHRLTHCVVHEIHISFAFFLSFSLSSDLFA